MNIFQRYILLIALSFFFGTFAVGLVSMKRSSAPESFIYVSPQVSADQSEPLRRAQNKRNVPQSVMSYQNVAEADNRSTIDIDCRPGPDVMASFADIPGLSDSWPFANAKTDDGLGMEILRHDDGRFFILTKNKDIDTGCLVMSGEGWNEAPENGPETQAK